MSVTKVYSCDLCDDKIRRGDGAYGLRLSMPREWCEIDFAGVHVHICKICIDGVRNPTPDEVITEELPRG